MSTVGCVDVVQEALRKNGMLHRRQYVNYGMC